jgi:hypothetical protein
MQGNARTGRNGDTFPETFAAELTNATYPIALRYGRGDSWIDLELDLWRVLAETVNAWTRDVQRARRRGEFEVWRECFLSELTDAAYRTALRQGITGSFLELELALYQALRSVIGDP